MHRARARGLPNDEKCNIPMRKRDQKNIFSKIFAERRSRSTLALLWEVQERLSSGPTTSGTGRTPKGHQRAQEKPKKAEEERKRVQERPKESHKCPRDTKRREKAAQEERKRAQKTPKESQKCPRDTKRSEKEPTPNAASLCSGSSGHPCHAFAWSLLRKGPTCAFPRTRFQEILKVHFS